MTLCDCLSGPIRIKPENVDVQVQLSEQAKFDNLVVEFKIFKHTRSIIIISIVVVDES